MNQAEEDASAEARAARRLKSALAELPEEVQEHPSYPPDSFADVVRILDETVPDDEQAERLRKRIADVRTFRWLLQREPADLDSLDRVLSWDRNEAADGLLDLVVDLEDRKLRRAVYERLAELGPQAGMRAVDRLDDERWFVRRNMLALLRETGVRPADFSALQHMEDEDPRVQLEAFKLAVADPGERDKAVIRALGADDERLLRLALAAAQESRPEASETLLFRHARNEELPEGHRASAVRALKGLESDDARSVLLELAWDDRPIRGAGLRKPTPVTVAALEVLADSWSGHPDVAPVLEEARSADDEAVREAVGA